MRAGISRGAAKGRKRHDSGPYIHTYILFSACLTTRKFSYESSEEIWYRIPSHSAKSCLWPSSPTHANATYQYCHPAMPHLAVLAEERAKRGRFSDAAELCTTIDQRTNSITSRVYHIFHNYLVYRCQTAVYYYLISRSPSEPETLLACSPALRRC